MVTLRQVLQQKGSDIYSISPSATVYEALQLMADKNIGALLVLERGALIGIISERDYARKIVLEGRSSKETRVRDIMTEKVAYVRSNQSIEECMALMTEKRIRHLPVMENDHLLGVISIGDIVRAVISEQRFVIEQLENYIKGAR